MMVSVKERRQPLRPDVSKGDDGAPETMRKGLVETALIVLAFVWLGLLITELAFGLSPFLSVAFDIIWVIFVADFLLEFIWASNKVRYLKHNWLTAVSLAIPALRIFRIFQVIRIFRFAPAVRGVRLLRLYTSFKRSARALGSTMRRRGFAYIVSLTLIVILAGAAGMYAFERDAPEQEGFDSYAESLWWTAMIITTLGSHYWPVTEEGRILCLFLSVYAFTVFGYIAAVLASHFIGRDAAAQREEVSAEALRGLRDEIAALRTEVQSGARKSSDV